MKQTMNDTAKVWIANMTSMALITLANLQALLAIGLTVLSMAYTIHKWRKDNRE
jgi:hypothetical protein